MANWFFLTLLFMLVTNAIFAGSGKTNCQILPVELPGGTPKAKSSRSCLATESFAHLRDGIGDAPHGDDGETGNRLLGLICLRDQRMREAQFRGFLESLLAALNRPHFAGQPHFAEDYQP